MGFEEKRQYQRRYFEESERYFIEYKPAGKFFAKTDVALTLNLSASGALFRATTLFATATVLKVKMTLPLHKKPIQMTAKVVRIEPTLREKIYNIALHFTEISDSDRALINQFCLDKKEEPPQAADSKPAPKTGS